MADLYRNRPTAEGRALGVELARFADAAAAEHPELPERCRTCAFRLGTVPNGCVTTQMDALKCAIEGIVFLCHERPMDGPNCPIVDGSLCAGWRLLRPEPGAPTRKAFWPFSDDLGGAERLLSEGAP